MWPFTAKPSSLREADVLRGITDWHSHILPGVDDGFNEMEDSLKALADLERLGVKEVWLTPHVMEDYPNEPVDLERRFEELKLAYSGNIKLHLGSENMLDALFEERLEKKDFLPMGERGSYLLVETSYFNPPMNLNGLIEKIKAKGYHPILAHPERYRYMNEKDYQRLREQGVLFQANIFSLVGAYGSTAQSKLEWLLKKDMVDFLGSDLHRHQALLRLIEKGPRKKWLNDALTRVGRKYHQL